MKGLQFQKNAYVFALAVSFRVEDKYVKKYVYSDMHVMRVMHVMRTNASSVNVK